MVFSLSRTTKTHAGIRLFARRACFSLSFVFIFAFCVNAQSDPTAREWNKPTEPFRIIGNVYYVGSEGISSFLITTKKGHILIDGGFEETAPQIISNIKRLGFDISQVRILLNSHSHYDHAGGLSELKQKSGARLLVTGPEARMLAQGGRNDFAYGDELPYAKVTADQIIRDGETIRLGNESIVALSTPGHTKGATTFLMTVTENGKPYKVVFASSISAPGYQLKNNRKYPRVASDLQKSFAILEKLPCDVFLTFHSGFFNMLEKRGRIEKVGGNPFIDRDGLRAYVKTMREQFLTQLAAEK